MRSTLAATLLAALMTAAAGCATTVSTDPYPPDLVYVSPGVQVIADYNEPIFYTDGYYWRQHGGGWYRSPRYTGGWVYASPPVAVLRIDRPHAYAHYRPNGWVGHPRRVAPAPAPTNWRGRPAPRPMGPPPAARRAPPPGPPAHSQPPPQGGGWRGNPNRRGER